MNQNMLFSLFLSGTPGGDGVEWDGDTLDGDGDGGGANKWIR